MFKWLKEYGESSQQTKCFTLNALVYGLAIIITTAYCYGRLDFVRSYRSPHMNEKIKQLEQIEYKIDNPGSQVTK